MTAEISSSQDRHSRRKPFSTFIKRLANLKSSSHTRPWGNPSGTTNHPEGSELPSRTTSPANAKLKQSNQHHQHDEQPSNNVPSSGQVSVSDRSGRVRQSPSTSTSTRPPTSTTNTAYSSPAASLRSLTTLTTVQSTAPPSTYLNNGMSSSYNPHPNHHHSNNSPVQLFSHQYPQSPQAQSSANTPNNVSSPAPSVIIAQHTHSAQQQGATHGHQSTYSTATNNNLLTDNASIITLASSSKRRRRSLDTDASIRALPPSSLWGGSKESLPLSVLSGGGDRGSLYATTVSGMGGVASPREAAYNTGVFERMRDEGDDDRRSFRSKRMSRGDTVESLPLSGERTDGAQSTHEHTIPNGHVEGGFEQER